MPKLSTVVYRSRAVDVDTLDLLYLLAQCRARNRCDGVTGLLVFDQGCFFQWMEGPDEPLARTWRAIRRDPRHEAIEVLAELAIPMRLFTDWHMQFAMRSERDEAALIDGYVAAPADVLDRLHRQPLATPSILAEFSALGRGPYARV